MASRREFLKGSVSAAALSGCSTLMPTQAADTLIVNGRIATLDPKNPNAEAIAIRGERIVEVGNPGQLEKYRGPNTRVIDAGRRIVRRQQVPQPRRIGVGYGEEHRVHRLTAGRLLHFDQHEAGPGQRSLESLRPRGRVTREQDMGTDHRVGSQTIRHRRTG